MKGCPRMSRPYIYSATCYSTPMENEINQPQTVILIHGTFASAETDIGDRWWQQGSSVHHTLSSLLHPIGSFDFEALRWSGANTEHDRLSAADKLCQRLQELERAGRPYHLLAHSHGGSVIWIALRTLTSRGIRLSNLRSWCTMGTPFFHFQVSKLNLWLVSALILLLLITFLPLGSPFGQFH